MKVNKTELKPVLRFVKAMAGDDKSIVDAFKTVRISVSSSQVPSGILEVSATNGIFAVKADVYVTDYTEDAVIFVSAAKFVEAVDKLGDEFEIKFNKNKLNLISGKIKISLTGTDELEAFPIIPDFPYHNYLEVDSETFLNKLNSVMPCVDSNHGNMTFRCISFKADSVLRIMGANGPMVGLNEMELSKPAEFSILILANFFKELKYMNAPTFRIAVDGSRMHIWGGNIQIQSIAVTNKMLNVSNLLIPHVDSSIITFDASKALEVMGVARLFANSLDRPDFCYFEEKDGEVGVFASSQDGVSDVSFPFEGEIKGKHGVNIKYVMDVLNVGFEKISLYLTESSKSPFIFKSSEDKDWSILIGAMNV